MVTRNERQNGFTLVEILIVVVILGILAAVVIPQFTDASTNAKKSSLVTQLQTLRSQLELYQIEHNGAYPDLVADGWDLFTGTTDEDGDVTGTDFGPYLQQAPANPFNGNTGIALASDADNGWIYNVADGSIDAVGFDESTGVYTAP